MLLSAVSVSVVAQSSPEIPEGLMNNPVNIVVVCCGTEVHLHAFSETALDGDVPLTSNNDGYFPAERTTGRKCLRGIA